MNPAVEGPELCPYFGRDADDRTAGDGRMFVRFRYIR